MSEWKTIESAPKDGSTVQVKRVYQGRVIYEGPAAWRRVHFGDCFDPLSGEKIATASWETGWMYPEGSDDKRVPEPTHWRS